MIIHTNDKSFKIISIQRLSYYFISEQMRTTFIYVEFVGFNISACGFIGHVAKGNGSFVIPELSTYERHIVAKKKNKIKKI